MFEIFFVLSVALCWAPCALGGSVSGRVFDDTSGTVSIPIQFAQVNITVGTTAFSARTDFGGLYSLSVSGTGTAVLAVQHAQYGLASRVLSVPAANVQSPSTWDQAMARLPSQTPALRVTLEWGSSPLDLDLRTVSYCGQVLWAFRRRNPGGVPIRIDQDVVNGFGPETITFGSNLPCGTYPVHVVALGKGVYHRPGASVTVYSGDNPTPINRFPSLVPSGDYKYWHVFDIVVSLDDSVRLTRSLAIVTRNLYSNNELPGSMSFEGRCVADIQWCAASHAVALVALLLCALFAAL